MTVYLDNSASTPLLKEAIEEMLSIMNSAFANPSSIHKPGRFARNYIEQARRSIADILSASVGEIFFSSGASESNNHILSACVRDLAVKHILISAVEHPSVVACCANINGAQCHSIPVDAFGEPDYDALEQMLKKVYPEKTLVSVMHANNELGTINDLNKLSVLCKDYDALFHTDATQSMGLLDIDLSKTNIDFLTASAHKFHGPKGIGFSFIKQNHALKPYIYGGDQERTMRAGTENIIGIAGMKVALEQVSQNRDQILDHMELLRTQFKSQLDNIFPDIRYFGQQQAGKYLPKILNVGFVKSQATELLNLNLDIHGICASGGSACSSGVESRSKIIELLDPKHQFTAIRFSFGRQNTLEEIDYVVQKLKRILNN